jgi:hypothetical protein
MAPPQGSRRQPMGVPPAATGQPCQPPPQAQGTVRCRSKVQLPTASKARQQRRATPVHQRQLLPPLVAPMEVAIPPVPHLLLHPQLQLHPALPLMAAATGQAAAATAAALAEVAAAAQLPEQGRTVGRAASTQLPQLVGPAAALGRRLPPARLLRGHRAAAQAQAVSLGPRWVAAQLPLCLCHCGCRLCARLLSTVPLLCCCLLTGTAAALLLAVLPAIRFNA